MMWPVRGLKDCIDMLPLSLSVLGQRSALCVWFCCCCFQSVRHYLAQRVEFGFPGCKVHICWVTARRDKQGELTFGVMYGLNMIWSYTFRRWIEMHRKSCVESSNYHTSTIFSQRCPGRGTSAKRIATRLMNSNERIRPVVSLLYPLVAEMSFVIHINFRQILHNSNSSTSIFIARNMSLLPVSPH